MTTAETRYAVTFAGAETTEAHDALTALAEEPRTLAEILDTCDEHGVRATLRDEQGSPRGWVRPGREYRLA